MNHADMLPTRVVLITPNFDNNSLGRSYCLWLLARHLGVTVEVHGVKGDRLWAPLASSAFAADCVLPTATNHEATIRSAVARAELVIAVKPLPTSFGLALRICGETGVPLLLDIDDPDIEVRTSLLPWHERVARRVLTSRYRELLKLDRLSRMVPRIVSNPTLQRSYGGTVVPHARELPSSTPHYSDSETPVVRFVGSPRGHKGMAELREALAPLAASGYTLEVTDAAPDDAHAWENWLGQTGLAEGAQLVASADIIAIPSLADSWSRAQLPAKLVDAMINGRAIVASRTDPIAWALGPDAGILVEPGDVDQLRAALLTLRAPGVRRTLGLNARERACTLFSVDGIAPAFAQALREVRDGLDYAANHPARWNGGSNV